MTLPEAHTSDSQATAHDDLPAAPNSSQPLEELPSRVVAEWQKRMRSGSCASILIVKEEESGKKAEAIFKHLEKFAIAIARVQREERDRQHSIMAGKLAKRNERRKAKDKRRKRSTLAKKDRTLVRKSTYMKPSTCGH